MHCHIEERKVSDGIEKTDSCNGEWANMESRRPKWNEKMKLVVF